MRLKLDENIALSAKARLAALGLEVDTVLDEGSPIQAIEIERREDFEPLLTWPLLARLMTPIEFSSTNRRVDSAAGVP